MALRNLANLRVGTTGETNGTQSALGAKINKVNEGAKLLASRNAQGNPNE